MLRKLTIKRSDMITIYEYPIIRVPHQIIRIPKKFQILDVQFQNKELMIWALVEESSDKIPIDIRIFMTGEDVKRGFNQTELIHLKTLQAISGTVLHIFRSI